MNNELRHYGVKGMKWGKRQSFSDPRYAPGSTVPAPSTAEMYGPGDTLGLRVRFNGKGKGIDRSNPRVGYIKNQVAEGIKKRKIAKLGAVKTSLSRRIVTLGGAKAQNAAIDKAYNFSKKIGSKRMTDLVLNYEAWREKIAGNM